MSFWFSFTWFPVVDEVWKQQTLLQLLQMVELPVLECILTSPERVQPQRCRAPAHGDLVISNTCLDREPPLNLLQSVQTVETEFRKHQKWLLTDITFSPLRLDAWLSAAADCLELFPDQLIVVAGEKLSKHDGDSSTEASNSQQTISHKRLLFDTIAKYYNGQEKAPLLSGRYLDIHAAILNLLGEIQKPFFLLSIFDCCHFFIFLNVFPDEGKRQEAIRASQLCLRLLDTSSREELRRLLGFMAIAAQPDACQLQKKVALMAHRINKSLNVLKIKATNKKIITF